MSAPWFFASILLPPAAALAAWLALRGRPAPPSLVIALNALMPGAGLAAAGRPLVEVGGGVILAVASLIIVGRIEDISYYLPIMAVGGAWGLLHTPLNPLTRQTTPAGPPRGRTAAATPPHPAPTPPQPKVARPTGEQPAGVEGEEEAGYAVSVRCTQCGADLDVPVLQRMVRCPFCASQHLVIGHHECLHLTLPQRIQGEADLREVVLDYYRYQYYVKLYQALVAPLDRQVVEAGPQGTVAARPELTAAVAAAERVVAQRADAHRRQLAEKLWLGAMLHFLAPYRHGMGTLYQAAFGRTLHDQEKALRFAVATVEASALSSPALNLPAMGKLSYLKALLPVAGHAEGPGTLPLEGGEDALNRAFGELNQKKLVRDLTVIRQGSVFSREITAVVWRPWWIVTVRGPDLDESLLVDDAAGSVVGSAPHLSPDALQPLPPAAAEAGVGLRFLPMECPTCGFELTFDATAVLHFCHNCHRVSAIDGGRKVEVEYDHTSVAQVEGNDLVPFWRFALRLRTGDGSLVTDLPHFKDGIDGTLDQIGDHAPVEQDSFCVPAIRCINSRLMVEAFHRLFIHTLSQPLALVAGRFPLDHQPQPWPAGLPESEARELAPLYLAMAFSRRDMVRVNVHQVAAWLFESRLESLGRLTYVYVPRAVTETFRSYVGRFHVRALADA